MRSARTTAAALALAGAAGLWATTAAGTPASAHGGGIHLRATKTIGLTVIPCEGCVLRPLGFNPGDHIGEFLIERGTLTDPAGKTVGHYAFHILGTTVATDVAPPEVQLTGTLSLRDGQITAQGLEEPPTEGGTIAVTGGTGRYRGARGELSFHDISDTTSDLVVNLT
jgi:hypothetical protein